DHFTGNAANTNISTLTLHVAFQVTVTAYFVRQYTLTMAVNPQEAGTTSPAVGTRIYDEGTVVTLTATAAPGYRFDHWTGSVANPNSASTTITMNSDKTVTAVFNKIGFILELDRNVINSILKEQALTETKINVTITPIEGFSNTVNLSGEVFAESGISFAFTPSSGIPPFSSALTLTISGDTRPDTYLMRITGKSGDIENFQELIIVGNTLLYVPITYCSSQQDTGVEIPVIISNAKGLAGFQFEFSFDSNILRVTGVTNGSLTSNWLIMSDAKTPGLIKIAGLNPHLSGDSKEGSIVVINCEIIGEIPEQGVPLTLGNIKLSDSEANAIPVVKEDGILFPRIKGDLNGSGEVDIFDVILCLRQALEIDPKSMLADMNGNGEVDIFDVILLLRIVLEID
ncbi:MAG: cohesin domain-containing protein, partial [Candidatus Omnitrophica bacterium]|nr:cohesin domain-containing protein [Candidatus Omnitrophota bacterium]